MEINTHTITSYIEDHEIAEANSLIEESFGFKLPRMCGNNMLVKLYVRDEDCIELKGKDGNPLKDSLGRIIKVSIPDYISTSEKYKTCTALVLAQGPDCYKGDEYEFSGDACRVGDFIVFARNECLGTQIFYRGVSMQVISDRAVYQVIKTPKDVLRYKYIMN